MRVLSVQIDESGSDLGQLADRRQPTVHIGATPTVDGNHPAEDPFVITVHESAFHARFGRTGAHTRRIGPTAHQQIDGLHDHRLAGPGFTGDGHETGSDDEPQLLDHPEVLDT